MKKRYVNSSLLFALLLALIQFFNGVSIQSAFAQNQNTNQVALNSYAATPQNISLKPYINVSKGDLDSAILAEMAKYKMVGVSAAFIKDGRVIWANGYGWSDLEKGKLASSDTIYRIASISKTIGATALMQLWEQGKFGLDDDISYYLGYKVRNPKYPNEKITFRMLLTHTSGILDGNSGGGYLRAINSMNPPLLKDLLVPGGKAYSNVTWGDYKPGTNFTYSNFNAGIAACLVEKISGERFDRYCANHIFKPLGMNAGYSLADITNIDKVAVLYKRSGDGKSFTPAYDSFREGVVQRQEYRMPLGNNYIGPAGGVRSSVTDLAKFMIAHMNGGVYNGVRILQKNTVDLMQQMHWFGDGYDGFYKQKGLNFHITDGLAGRRLTGHAGEAYGLMSDMYFDRDENIGVIFMTNGGYYDFLSSGFTNIEDSVINKIFDKLAGKTKPVTRTIRVTKGDNKLVVNGRTIVFPVPAEIKAGEIFVPAISLADALEAKMDFNNNTNTLTLSIGSSVVSAKVGKASLQVNNARVPLKNAPYFKNGNIMLPLGQISKSIDANVNYSPKETVIISKNQT